MIVVVVETPEPGITEQSLGCIEQNVKVMVAAAVRNCRNAGRFDLPFGQQYVFVHSMIPGYKVSIQNV